MNDQYLTYVIHLLKELKNDTGYVWAWEDTGGGCDALFLHFNGNNSDDGYFMVTYDASVPADHIEWSDITLGRYTSWDEGCEIIEEVTTYDQLVTYLAEVAPKLSQWKFA
jgi:hypothetical protein